MNKYWWCFVALPCALVACSEADSDPGPRATGGGSSDGEPTQPEDSPPRARRGEVTLLGMSPSLSTASWSLVGPPSGADEDEATVSCSVTEYRTGVTLEVSAAASGSGVPSVKVVAQMSALGPLSQDLTFDERLDSQPFSLDVSLPGDLQYGYGYDVASSPVVRSSCSVVLSRADERNLAGQVACRNLLPTAGSADATPSGAGGARASVTVAFDCPVVVHGRPEPEPSGGSSGGGRAGSGGGAGKAGGGAGGGGGAAGTGGGSEPVKSCQGIASSCSSQSSGTCSAVKGCSTEGECRGVSSGCYSQYSSYACTSQQGCYWSSLNKSCSGSAWSCSSMSGSASCVSQSGCNWSLTCEGLATPCSLLPSELECGLQPGCSWR